MVERAVVVLAAGLGTRMKSQLPKVLHRLYGQPLLAHVLRKLLTLEPARLLVVVGYREELVRETFRGWPVQWVSQPQQLGTGHAATVASEALEEFDGEVAVVMGDTVFLEPATLERAFAEQRSAQAAATVVTGILEDPTGFGRILRDDQGRVRAIVEERDASPEEKAIREVNSGCYTFQHRALAQTLRQITPENKQQEYYLTDVVSLLVGEGETVISVAAQEAHEILGVNTRAELAAASRLLQERTLKALMLDGVTVTDPPTTHVDPRARVTPDTVIEPFCILEGALLVEAGCHLGPYCHLVGRRGLDPPGAEPDEVPVLAGGTELGRGRFVLEKAGSDSTTVRTLSEERPGAWTR